MPQEPSRASSAVSSTAEAENGAHFDENHPRFYVFSLVHCRLASIVSSLFGCLCVIGIFVFFVCHFQWYVYDTAVDVVVLTGISIFLLLGILVHYLALRGVHKEKPIILNPFIGFHLFLALIEVIVALTAIGELVSDQTAKEELGDVVAKNILFVVPLIIFIQVIMLCCVIKYKSYLRRKLLFIKRNHSSAITQVMYGNATVEMGESASSTRS
uniref:MARVEL domain-containing protein n=1 Tax=Steinernema glaseri TaxID=37863 RepID=A0A1I7ZNT1_9BILA